jgi:hypothetical protein
MLYPEEHIQELKATGRPAFLTVDGQPEIVVQSAEGYRGLIDDQELLDSIRGAFRYIQDRAPLNAERWRLVSTSKLYAREREFFGGSFRHAARRAISPEVALSILPEPCPNREPSKRLRLAMKRLLVLPILCAVVLMSGCYMNAKLYPVSGPAPNVTQQPVLSARLSGVLNSGSISINMPDGKVRKGSWTRMAATSDSSSQMQGVWDSVYGSGYYLAHVVGRRLYAQGSVTGEQGNVYQVEFYKTDNVQELHLFGIAKDSSGTIYKIVFGA